MSVSESFALSRIAPAEVIVTSSAAVTLPTRMFPEVVVVTITSCVEPPAVIVPSVRLAASAVSVTLPVPVVTVVNVTAPPPVWSNRMLPVPVISVPTSVAVARALLRSMLPSVVSAVMFDAARFTAVVLPIPVTASRSTVSAVTRPPPLIPPPSVCNRTAAVPAETFCETARSPVTRQTVTVSLVVVMPLVEPTFPVTVPIVSPFASR